MKIISLTYRIHNDPATDVVVDTAAAARLIIYCMNAIGIFNFFLSSFYVLSFPFVINLTEEYYISVSNI